MKKRFTQAIAVFLISVMSLTLSGCFGSFALTSKLHDWNGTVSDSKFVNELVFLGLCIIPVYELACLGDALIFNSIEFWGETNPIAMKAGEVEESEILHEGAMYKMTKSRNFISIAQNEGDVKVNFQYFPEEKAWYVMDGEQKVKVVEMKNNTVYTYLPNNKTLVFDKSTANMVQAEIAAAR